MMGEKDLRERQKQVMEAEQKVQILKQKLGQTEARARQYNTEGKRAMFTEAELKTLPEDARTFKSVGRMFILRPCSEMINETAKRQKNCKDEVEKNVELKNSLEKQYQEAEAEFQKLYKQLMEELKMMQEQAASQKK